MWTMIEFANEDKRVWSSFNPNTNTKAMTTQKKKGGVSGLELTNLSSTKIVIIERFLEALDLRSKTTCASR